MKKNIIAKTFTPLYDEVEDRLRVVVNYEDIHNRVDFMITRNFVLNLVPSAEEFIVKYYGSIDFKEDTKTPHVEQETKNDSISKTDNANLELLRTEEELLTEVNFSFDNNTKYTLMKLNSKNITASISIDGFMLLQIFKVIKSAIPYIRWGIAHHF